MIEAQIDIPENINRCLSRAEWLEQQRKHRQKISEIVDPYLRKKQEQHKDPVLDFLFEYYAFRPSHLKRWSPGLGVFLESADTQSAPEVSKLTIGDEGAWLNPDRFPGNRKSSAEWILSVLENSLENDPSFGCFGMHEWAMVYKADQVRHNQLPLRMEKEELTQFVESRPLMCTHFDAFRFFTKPAKPLNKFDLSRDDFQQTEQSGCLHTNMDLYKWAFKLFPWISSNTIREAFVLAVHTRRIDMQASPYDLSAGGLEPIRIETKAGRLEYIRHQKEIYRRSMPIRRRLIKEYRQIIMHF
jgi:hypothetical protein